jgi:NAD-dependent deacetylase
MDLQILKTVARKMFAEKGKNVALTGAGISVESGIPDFRGAGGLWEKYNPSEYATREAFEEHPEKVWKMLRELDEVVSRAKPNAAHLGLARLETMGLLESVITQNIDNLHQDAGSRNVIEFHGNCRRLVCLHCRSIRDTSEARRKMHEEFPPRCPSCNAILKPDVVLFGEQIPQEAASSAMKMAQEATLLLIVGTSATVAPASYLPVVSKKVGATLVEINTERTALSDGFVHHSIQGRAGEIIPKLVEEIENLSGRGFQGA